MSYKFPFKLTVSEKTESLIELIVDYIEKSFYQRLYFDSPKPLGLATGRTMTPIYKSLVKRLNLWPQEDLKLLKEGWCSFNLDEYVGLDTNDNRSFWYYIHENLSIPLGIQSGKFFTPNGKSSDPNLECNSYLSKLKIYGGIGIQFLGLGANGHVGFNEPPCDYKSSCRVVSLSDTTRKQNSFAFGDDLKKVPESAITLGIDEILNSEEIHLIVTGDMKSNILRKLLISSPSENLPASWLKLHKKVFLWVDGPAYKYFK